MTNPAFNRQRAKELSEKADYLEFQYIRMQEISEYIAVNAGTLSSDDVDFLLSWLNHSNFNAEEIISMLSENEENGE